MHLNDSMESNCPSEVCEGRWEVMQMHLNGNLKTFQEQSGCIGIAFEILSNALQMLLECMKLHSSGPSNRSKIHLSAFECIGNAVPLHSNAFEWQFKCIRIAIPMNLNWTELHI